MIVREAQAYFGASCTVREPLVVLDRELRGLGQWGVLPHLRHQAGRHGAPGHLWARRRRLDIPRLRELLEKILPTNSQFDPSRSTNVPGRGAQGGRPERQAVRAPDGLARLILLAMEEKA
jgi:hypothetical protein